MTANTPPEIAETTASTLQEFINWYSGISIPVEHRCLYRGEANKGWSIDKDTQQFLLSPAVYRNPEFRKNESILYNELLSSDPGEFKEDATLLDRLARMQHYGLPTRLLDITTNPLVALYFACADDTQHESDGKVVMFHIPEHEINYSNTLPAVSLSGIESPLDFVGLFNSATQQYTNILRNGFNNVIRCAYVLLNSQEYIQSREQVANFSGFANEYEVWSSRLNDKKDLSWDGRHGTLSSYMNNLHGFYSDFDGIISSINIHARECRAISILESKSMQLESACMALQIDLLEATDRIITGLCARVGIGNERKYNSFLTFLMEFTSYRFICPPMRNERLRRQHGLFLVCPPYPAEPITPVHSAFIPHAKKDYLLKELEKVGIDNGQLFPELDVKARELKKRFGPKPDSVNTIAPVNVE